MPQFANWAGGIMKGIGITPGFQSMLLSTFCFSLANLCVKFVSHLPAMEVVFFRCSLGVLFCWYGLRSSGADWLGSSRLILALRGVFGTFALFLFFTTLQNMPLASAVTIAYLSPVFTAVLAMFLLREDVAGRQWMFFGMAFLGVVLIERFDPRISPVYLAMGVASAFFSGVAYNLVRSLRGREHPLVVVLHFQFVGALAGLLSLPFIWTMPVGKDWLWLGLIAVFSQFGQIFLTNALQSEKASSVSIAGYSGVVYGLMLGWMFLEDVPAGLSFVGIALVVGGMIASIYFSKKPEAEQEIHLTQA
jgi:drug/metabolite transporter (DMT)-like permease